MAVIAPDAPFYVSAAQGFKTYAEKYGLEVVHYEIFPVDLTDLTPILQTIKAKNPNVISMGSHTVPAMMLMRNREGDRLQSEGVLLQLRNSHPRVRQGARGRRQLRP